MPHLRLPCSLHESQTVPNVWVGKCPLLNVVTQGVGEDDAREALKEAVILRMAMCGDEDQEGSIVIPLSVEVLHAAGIHNRTT